MNISKILKYNITSSTRFGWEPIWFGVKHHEEELIHAIIAYQKANHLKPDGMVGMQTFRRIFTDREVQISKWKPSQSSRNTNNIVYNGEFFPIKWDKVILWDEEEGLKAKDGCYRKQVGEDRDIKLFVNHWDVCLSSASCQNVLNNRGISVHFLIDNDGTIFQTVDMQHQAWHCGNQNPFSVGVEISNAYYIDKYQDWYVRNGFGERPIVQGKVRGKDLDPHLGFYPIQIEAAQALWRAVANACDIPLRCPIKNGGEEVDSLFDPAVKGEWKGFVHHYQISNKKIDCGGFDLTQYLGK